MAEDTPSTGSVKTADLILADAPYLPWESMKEARGTDLLMRIWIWLTLPMTMTGYRRYLRIVGIVTIVGGVVLLFLGHTQNAGAWFAAVVAVGVMALVLAARARGR